MFNGQLEPIICNAISFVEENLTQTQWKIDALTSELEHSLQKENNEGDYFIFHFVLQLLLCMNFSVTILEKKIIHILFHM